MKGREENRVPFRVLSRARTVVGPAIVAAAVWAARGVITPSSIAAPNVRFGEPASAAWFAGAFVLAFACTPLRRSPALALPGLLAILPWLPIPLPTVAYLWTGGLAWLPVVLPFLGAALVASPARRDSPRVWPESPRANVSVAAAFTLALTVAAAVSLRHSLPAGDEPHYLVITESLLKDGDLRIENNHRARDYRAYYDGTADPQFLRRGKDGEIYPVHMPGTSLLVLPLFKVAGYRGAQATMVLAAVATGALLWLLAWLATGDRVASWFTWASVVGSVTFLAESVTIFPDLPAALGTTIAACVVVSVNRGDPIRMWSIALASVALAALPFFHTRFAVIAGLLGLALGLALLRAPAFQSPSRVRALAAFVLPSAAGILVWFGYFWAIYGSLNPTFPYGDAPETSARFMPGGVAGLMFDQQFGLLASMPVLAVAFSWWPRRSSPLRFAVWSCLVTFVTYAAAVSIYWMWWAGGPAPPARFLTAALPLLAPTLGIAWTSARAPGRRILLMTLVASLAISSVSLLADEGRLFANTRDARALWLDWLGGTIDLPHLWPSFFRGLDPANLWTEWAFAGHAAMWIAVFAGGAWLVRQVSTTVVPVLFWVPVSLMIVATASAANGGWKLRPALDQLAILRAADRGKAVLRVAPNSVRLVDQDAIDMIIEVPRTEGPESRLAEWLVLPDVPAGSYDFRIRLQRPRDGGTLAIRQGREPMPIWTLTLTAQSVQTFRVDLRSDVRRMWLVPNDSLAATAQSLEILPIP
jgi:hypothetical protein